MSEIDKPTLRAKCRAARAAMTADAWSAGSAAIAARLWGLPEFARASSVLSYVSSKENEVDTRNVMAGLLEEGRRVAAPAVVEGGRIVWRVIADLADLAPGRFGIDEPDSSCAALTTFHETDVALVPGVAFSRDGHRLGLGGGCFDRFLCEFPGTSIGLAFDFQIVPSIPAEEHDVALDLVVSESKVYRRTTR